MRDTVDIAVGFGLLGTTNTAPVSDDTARQIIDSALGMGIRRFDTAPLYGGGLSEERLGALLDGIERSDYELSSKVGRYRPYAEAVSNPGSHAGDWHDYSHDAVLRSIESSLERLRTDRLDIVFIHDCDDFIDEAIDKAWPALVSLKEQGVISRIGCGSNRATTHEQLLAHLPLDIIMAANCHSLLQQPALERLFPMCQAASVEVELAAPFNSGILATGADDPAARYNYAIADETTRQRVRVIEACCQRHGVPLKRAALQYAARHPVVSRLVLGVADPTQLSSNVQDLMTPVPDSLWQELALLDIPAVPMGATA